MIKNFTLIIQPVKNGSSGLFCRENYLNSQTHANHKSTDEIINIYGSSETTKRLALAGESFKLMQKAKNKKGGRPLSSYAMELCLTLPKGHRPRKDQWMMIVRDCCRALVEHLQLTKDERIEFGKNVRAVCHRQNQDFVRGTGDHVHLIIPKIVNDKVLIGLQKRAALSRVKQAYNVAILEHLNLDSLDYIPQKTEVGKRLELWKYHNEGVSRAVGDKKLLIKLQKQIDKWEMAKETLDLKQMRRQKNRIESSLKQMSDIERKRVEKYVPFKR